ncbi:hypothetical protein AB0F46_18680 [Streptomyces sp. NPDC026665]|uniref:hypothetical protein n=1 Tax=Streptomyces sp. NPDC026665 TaxID=3154798 RepID=UPI00340B7A54
MPEAEGGPELLSLSEVARRVVAEGIEERMSHQRVSQLSREDPDFPPTVPVGRSKAVDWRLAAPYFRKRVKRQGKRTDLETEA